MNIKLELHGLIDVNCYILKNLRECYIIDPGFETERIRQCIKSKQLNVLGILLTHGHVDHIGAAHCFSVPVYAHRDEKKLILDDELNGFSLFGVQKEYDANTLDIRALDEGSELPLGSAMVKVLHTPGHTAGSVCFLHGDDLYSGDTLFKGSVGRCDLPTGSSRALIQSINRLLKNLDDSIKVYSGHGESTSIRLEKQHNPWYR